MTTTVWIDKRHPQTGKLLFRYDPVRGIIHIKPNGQSAVYVDLTDDRQTSGVPLDKSGARRV